MKIKLITGLLLMTTVFVFSQTKYFYGYGSDAHSNYNITHFGNISIGEIVSNNQLVPLTLYRTGNVAMEIKNSIGKLQLLKCSNCGPNVSSGDAVIRNLGSSNNMIFSMPNNNDDGNSRIVISDDLHKNNFIVYNNGKVTIGTNTFDSENYNLYVKNGIKTEKIKVEFADINGWADYVFEKNYNLMSLNKLEEFINLNKHLPEIPSANDVLDNGVELKEMTVLLLKKIEELSLHIIELNKKIERKCKK